ncbi:hypothetical protein DFP72DRAFT_856589 [Ephemerocybe angulata]|uniref:Uncharacterized protein n=1 Tax=Ephemerocybe angulata TaxID=980116 RepID=A0A8H6HFJ3_9AGAR|nr:hypothetical protein DFP72DRAFT_856589 [Tulosesus angulatus]
MDTTEATYVDGLPLSNTRPPFLAHDTDSNFESQPDDPIRVVSFQDLVDTGNALLDSGRHQDLAKLVISGIGPGYRVALDPEEFRLWNDIPRSIHRFYGALHGLSHRILVTKSSLTLVTRYQQEFRVENTFLRYSRGAGDPVAVCDMPCHPFATFGDGNTLTLCFPNLAPLSGYRPLTIGEFRVLWDAVIGPAVAAATSRRRSDGPVRQYSSSTLPVVSSTDIPSVVEQIRLYATASAYPWLQDILFLHVVRGKSELHMLGDHAISNIALDDFVEKNGLCTQDILNDEDLGSQWYVDVGVDMASPLRCCTWRLDGHSDAYRALTGEDLDSPNISYAQHPVSHITQAATCTITSTDSPLHDRTPDIIGVQLGIDDDVLSAVGESGRPYSTVSAPQIVQKADNLTTFLNGAAKLYTRRKTLVTNHAVVRGRFGIATRLLIDIDPQVLAENSFAFPSTAFWDWRRLCTYAYSYIIEQQRWQRYQLSMEDCRSAALLLTAAVTYLFNGLHSNLRGYDSDSLPFSVNSDRGIVFLDGVHFGAANEEDIPRFIVPPSDDQVAQTLFTEIAGVTMDELDAAFATANGVVPSPYPPHPAPAGNLPFHLSFPLIGPMKPFSLFSDYDWTTDQLLGNDQSAAYDSSTQHHLRQLSSMFHSDILHTAPRRRSGESCLRLDPNVHDFSDDAIFKETNLANIFFGCRWKHATHAEWTRCFDKLFPPQGISASNLSIHYRHCGFYGLWQELGETLSPISFAILRTAVWNTIFKNIYWLPLCTSDRIWAVRPMLNFHSAGVAVGGVPLPVLIINGPSDPEFDTTTLTY